ncbi:MAG: chorismate mutase [Lachnospiraceae bacterium]|nr:chorismate mutase [Lachnospiraceae bacterium]
MLDLNKIRDNIDETDQAIIELFEKRMKLCEEVAEYKIETGKQVLDTTREKQKLEKVTSLATGDFNKKSVEELFKQIMAMSRKMQYQILERHGADTQVNDVITFEETEDINKDGARIVYQGLEGAYAHDAVCQYFGEDADMYHVDTWKDAMEDVRDGKADYAVLPIENSTAGIVSQVYDLLVDYDNYIVAETFVKVEHALLGTQDADISDIQVVYSHPQSLMQSAKFLDEHREWQQISLSNNAVSAKKVADEQDKTHGAIASVRAGKLYGLKVLKEKVNYSDVNTTRFVVVAKNKVCKKDAGKISICFEIAHESGSLYNMLSHIIFNNLNMTKIESRPIEGRKWEYRFFIDFEGRLCDAAVRNTLKGIAAEAINMKILGNY